MSILRTRIGGWPVSIVRQDDSAAVGRIRSDAGPVPESLRNVYTGPPENWLLPVLIAVTADVNQWVSSFMWRHPAHRMNHRNGEATGCAECRYAERVAERQNREDPEVMAQPLPSLHQQDPAYEFALWHKGRRVREVLDYYTTGAARTGDLVHWCHVEALSTTGEILCATARVDEVTYWAYRPV